ncbi:hypothetical protein RIF29_02057 [Crotalaria pallida]|uniref:Uncharacterized protein n=1 Tax=Crotalaria pallida TaxID=3830 RepID=A0AAN9P8D5_CROPI
MDHRVAMPVRMTPTMGLELSFNSTTTIRHGAALHHGLSFQPTVRRCSREASIRPARSRDIRCRGFDNDPSAGSPTETLLRLLLPLNDKVQWTSHNVAGSEPPTSPQSEHFTGPFNR